MISMCQAFGQRSIRAIIKLKIICLVIFYIKRTTNVNTRNIFTDKNILLHLNTILIEKPNIPIKKSIKERLIIFK